MPVFYMAYSATCEMQGSLVYILHIKWYSVEEETA